MKSIARCFAKILRAHHSAGAIRVARCLVGTGAVIITAGCSVSSELDAAEVQTESELTSPAVLVAPTPDDFTYFKPILPTPDVMVPRPGGGNWIDPCELYSRYSRFHRTIGDACGELSIFSALSEDGSTLAISGSNGKVASSAICDEIAANFEQGGIYIYRRHGLRWALEQFVVPPVSACHDAERPSLSLSKNGNTLVVGMGASVAPIYDQFQRPRFPTTYGRGKVVVFERTGNAWNVGAQLPSPMTDANVRFGAAVALSGNGRVLAASAKDTMRGPVIYLYEKTGSAWTQVGATITGERPLLNIDGSVLAAAHSVRIGPGGSMDDEKVLVYSRSSSTTWALDGTLIGDPTYDKYKLGDVDFGSSLSMSERGDRIAVGAPREWALPDDTKYRSGSAYLFENSSAGWKRRARVVAPVPVEGSEFGTAVALSRDGKSLAVGAPYENWMLRAPGRVYTYQESAGSWASGPEIVSPYPTRTSQYGYSLRFAQNGSRLLIGALNDTSRATGVNGDPEASKGHFSRGSVLVAKTR